MIPKSNYINRCTQSTSNAKILLIFGSMWSKLKYYIFWILRFGGKFSSFQKKVLNKL